MAIPKTFTAITAQVRDGKLKLLVAYTPKESRTLYDDNGLSLDRCLDFLFGLRNGKASGQTFVCYAFSRDNEFMFSELPDDMKDRLFEVAHIRKRRREIADEMNDLETIFYNKRAGSDTLEDAAFCRTINKAILKDLRTVEYKGYNLQLINGKRLVIRKNKHQVVIHDIYGFFNRTLREAVNTWLGKDIAFLSRDDQALQKKLMYDQQLKAFAMFEAKWIHNLIVALQRQLTENHINLRSFHGASALTSWVLSKSGARSKSNPQYHCYRYPRQLPPPLRSAVMRAFFGGRIELFKIGTVQDVKVYDLNGAYGYGASLLPIMLRKPIYSRNWTPEPFSLWHCEYDFQGINAYMGLLPNRFSNGQIGYSLRGKGVYWQPEVAYILEHYPQCIEVKSGYVLEYERAPFTYDIMALYDLRNHLKALGSPLEKIIKLAIASIYGKFCQTRTRSEYFNMFYAGYITSVTRSQLLKAVKGSEHETVCFLTDAIHTRATLDVPVSDELGEYRANEYMYGTYLDNGVYRVIDYNGKVKVKSSGYRTFDFDKALREFQNTRKFRAMVEYFTGHGLHSAAPIRYANYLELTNEQLDNRPIDSACRIFNSYTESMNLLYTYIDSAAFNLRSDKGSLEYQAPERERKPINLDSVMAERVLL